MTRKVRGNTYDFDVERVDLSGPLPRVELNLLPDVDHASLPQSSLKDAPKKARRSNPRVRSTKES